MQDKNKMIKSVFLGVLSTFLITIIFISLCSVVIMKTGLLSTELTDYIMLALLSMAVFCGGFISAKINKSAGLICGGITGIIIFLTITLTSIIINTTSFSTITLLRLIFCIIAGMFGGVLGVNQKEKINIK